MLKEKTIKVLFLPAWYTSEKEPVEGVFIKEHANAVNLYDDIVVLYIAQSTYPIKKLYTVSDKIDDGIRTIV